MDDAPTCRCGHGRAAHEHFRRGLDCGACGSAICRRFRRVPAARTVRGPAGVLSPFVA